MKAIVIKAFRERLDEISVTDLSIPQPKSDELLIKVVAAGVNFVDILYVKGQHQNNKRHMKPPFTLGLEFAGVVVSAPSVSSFKIGDAVFGDCLGSYAEYLTIPAESSSLQRIPPPWTFTQAAGLGATLPVAYGALVLRAGLKAGETVLVHSAAGGLGLMATQVAVALGCKVLGTAGSAAKCTFARKLGASECFDYSREDWWDRVMEATGGQGVDVVFDPVGLIERSLKCTAHRGRMLVVGFAGLDGQMEKIAMNRILLKQVTLIGYRYGESHRRYPGEKEYIWRDLQHLIKSGKVKLPQPTCYSSLSDVSQALQDLSNRKISGKAVIQVGLSDKDDTRPML